MGPLTLATIILLVILIAGILAGAITGKRPSQLFLGVIGGATFLVGAGALVCSPGFSAGVVGGGDSSGVTVPFHGEEVPADLLPALRKMTKGPLSLPRTLSDLEEGPEYSAFKTNLNPRLHYGQRKLLLTEVAFLTRWGHLAKEVVYVGAAPGTHIPYLAHLFPEHHFVLYDSGDFVFVNYPEARKRITTHQRYFTDQDAKGYEKRDVLFISDIRGGISDEEAALAAAADMELQAGWVETIRPRATMLKFRLPWEAGETEYFAGELRLQPWAPKTTNETRLEFEGVPERKPYSHGEYDRKLHYLNEGLRQWGFFKGRLPPDVPGVDHCFSCALEVVTWEEFLEAGYGNGADVSALMNEATEAVGQRLDLAPHGVDPKIPMVKKRERLIRACEDGVFPCEPQARKKAARRKKFARRRRKTTPPQK